MLAGVGGIDAALLVIAADEGVMPQTREHLAILDLLAVPAAVVALTKIDLIDDPEWLDLIELDIVELLQDTQLADAQIVRVSATGRRRPGRPAGSLGPDVGRAAAAAQSGPSAPAHRPHLQPEGLWRRRHRHAQRRPFSRSAIAVEIAPGGAAARIRGLQTHGRAIERGEPGSRLAINLSGIGVDEIHRGEVVVRPDTMRSTVLVDLSFRLLADAAKPMVHNQAVDFFVGATEVPARCGCWASSNSILGKKAGCRYDWRGLWPWPPATVSSCANHRRAAHWAAVLVLSPHPRRRWKRFDPAVLERFQTLDRGVPDEILLQTLARHPFATSVELMAQSGLDLEMAADALGELIAADAVVVLPLGGEQALITVEAWEQVLRRLTIFLTAYHHDYPLRRGMARGEARSRLQASPEFAKAAVKISARLFNAMLDYPQALALIASDDAFLWLADFVVSPSEAQQARINAMLARFSAAPYASPNAADTLALLGGDADLLEMVVEQGLLLRLGNGVLFRTEDFAAAAARIQAHLNEHGSITLAEVRDLFDTSRKYAQALLEELDARRITRREGDARVLRADYRFSMASTSSKVIGRSSVHP